MKVIKNRNTNKIKDDSLLVNNQLLITHRYCVTVNLSVLILPHGEYFIRIILETLLTKLSRFFSFFLFVFVNQILIADKFVLRSDIYCEDK